MRLTKKLREAIRREYEVQDRLAAELKESAEEAERDLMENWDREMIHEPAQREKERRAKNREIHRRFG